MAGTLRCAPGGVGRNIAENLARLGIPVDLLCVVGDDAWGRQLLVATAAAGVGMDHAVTVPAYRTATYLAVHQADGELAVAVNDMELLSALTPAVCAASPALHDHGGWLLLDCNLPQDTLEYLLSQQRPVAVDAVSVAKCPRIAGAMSRIDVLKLNHLEAAALCGFALSSPALCDHAVRYFLDQGVGRVLISAGGEGVAWGEQGAAPQFFPAHRVPVVNATGAGDALISGFLAALLRGATTPDAVAYGVGCAEITLSSTFATSPELTHAQVGRHLGKTA
ncbi:MAG: carbohydrate kinase family protein [Rhodoferax sp.]|nr:carbohydrate kinase family protein [Rhodoferax sp.]